jgi:glutathione peroxidase
VDWHRSKDLEAIYKEYKDQNFVIIGFPANNFGSQEPELMKSCFFLQQNYNYFPMMDKVSVKEVICVQCVYQFLTLNGLEDSDVAGTFKNT